MKKFYWTLIFLFFPFSSYSANEDSGIEILLNNNLSGWKGIVFICSFDSKDVTLEKICNRAITDIELLAASNKINIKISRNNDFFSSSIIASTNNFITLEYKLHSTQRNGQNDVKAVYARLAFEVYYSAAIEKKLILKKDNTPRSGSLELWSEAIIGTGTPLNIVKPFSDDTETLLKKAIILFLKYSKNA